MAPLLTEINARTRLAGTNQMEMLLFDMAHAEVYGINVFKVREVVKMCPLARMPETDSRIEGMVNLRGKMMPVINLWRVLGVEGGTGGEAGQDRTGYLIVAEYSESLQCLHVARVDRIIRTSWERIKAPPTLLRNPGGVGTVTAVTTIDDGRMVMILDVEKILSDIMPPPEEDLLVGVKAVPTVKVKHVFFADDSQVARTQIRKTLEKLGMKYSQTTTGREAWNQLVQTAERAEEEGKTVAEVLDLILTDIEMPEMDGFTLTKHIRSDPRFSGIPIIIYSSLIGDCSLQHGLAIGATDVVTKFNPKVLAETIQRHC